MSMYMLMCVCTHSINCALYVSTYTRMYVHVHSTHMVMCMRTYLRRLGRTVAASCTRTMCALTSSNSF